MSNSLRKIEEETFNKIEKLITNKNKKTKNE